MIRRLPTGGLRAAEVVELRDLFAVAWPDEPERFTDRDWDHAVGGTHFVLELGGAIVAHASVVERELDADGHRLRTGYVEAVATRPEHQGRGHGSAVMTAVGEHIDRSFELGALGTDRFSFYERLGWIRWRGPTAVRAPWGPVRTAEEDGYVFVRLTPASPELDPSGPISCDWREGDVW